MASITRLLEFDAGHRVHGHESKCGTLHGHRYRVEVEAAAPGLDAIGRVIDFSVLKARVGGWLDLHWDHNTIVFERDEETIRALRSIPRRKDPWVAPWNPTAENMAHFLLYEKCPELLADTPVTVTRVTVYETPNCWATSPGPGDPAVRLKGGAA